MRYIFSFFAVALLVGAFPSGVSAARFCSLPQGVGTSQDSVPKNTEVNCYEDGSFFYTSRIVPVGTTMTFVNYSKEPLRVASGPHPTHDELPDFDSVKDVGENERKP